MLNKDTDIQFILNFIKKEAEFFCKLFTLYLNLMIDTQKSSN